MPLAFLLQKLPQFFRTSSRVTPSHIGVITAQITWSLCSIYWRTMLPT